MIKNTFEQNYNHKIAEKKIREKWFKENNDLYFFNENEENIEKNYIIDTPPPGVSGTLHMGHIFSYCHTDLIARYKRMKGFNVFYPIGFDNNGQPSEKLVEKIIEKRSHQISQEEFLTKCNEILPKAEKEYEELFKTIGYSYDWRQKYETGSEFCTKVAENSFKDLLEKDLIYEKFAPVYWDIVDQTALSQADIIDIEKEGIECRIKIKVLVNDNCSLGVEIVKDDDFEIMTTRPELLPACVAVFYHPDDERYNKILQNQMAILPFANPVAFLADKDVKPDKGSGLVMCCSYGDIQDKIWIQRHKLESNVIIQKDGRLKHFMYRDREYFLNAEGNKELLNDELKLYPYRIKQCREMIIKKLEEQVFLIEKKDIKHIVKCGEYSKAPIEIIESNQWYLKTLDFKEDFLEIVKHIDFHPAHYKNRLIQWIENLNQDWCISRDRVFGIKIPYASYKIITGTPSYKRTYRGNRIIKLKINEEYVNIDDIEGYTRDGIIRGLTDNEDDANFILSCDPKLVFLNKVKDQVFDTWFTSSLTPQIGVKNNKSMLPNSLRPQAHEIIRTWAFYTIVKSYLHGLTNEELKERNAKVIEK